MEYSHQTFVASGQQTTGHDDYCFSRLEPDAVFDAAGREGLYSAEARRLKRQASNRFVQKWLLLRSKVLRRDQVVDRQVTPNLLKLPDVTACSILRMADTGADSGTVARLDTGCREK